MLKPSPFSGYKLPPVGLWLQTFPKVKVGASYSESRIFWTIHWISNTWSKNRASRNCYHFNKATIGVSWAKTKKKAAKKDDAKHLKKKWIQLLRYVMLWIWSKIQDVNFKDKDSDWPRFPTSHPSWIGSLQSTTRAPSPHGSNKHEIILIILSYRGIKKL